MPGTADLLEELDSDEALELPARVTVSAERVRSRLWSDDDLVSTYETA